MKEIEFISASLTSTNLSSKSSPELSSLKKKKEYQAIRNSIALVCQNNLE